MLVSLSANDTLHVDLDNTQIHWIGQKVTGEHSGSLHLSNGWVVLAENVLIGGKFIFDMTSISNTDIESPEWKLKLEDHLKSEDFFHVDSFPYAVLDIKGDKLYSNNKDTLNNRIFFFLLIICSPHLFKRTGSINVTRPVF